MIFEDLVYTIGTALTDVSPIYYLIFFIVFMCVITVISFIYKFHIKKYTFQDYKTGMIRLTYISGLGILSVIACVLLIFIFLQS